MELTVKVLTRAYLNENLGDDLFVYILCNRYPNIKFSIVGENQFSGITKEIANLKFISEDAKHNKIINKIYKSCQKIKGQKVCNRREIAMYNILSRFYSENVFVTGSYFIQNPEWFEMEDAKWYSSRPHILGCNFGPYDDEKYFIEHKKQFAKCKEIGFRESYSYDMFKELSNVFCAPDLVFALDSTSIESDDNGEYIISVVNLAKDNDEHLMKLQTKYVQLLVDIISELRKKNQKVTLMSFCSRQGDDEVIEEVLSKLDSPEGVSTFYYAQQGIVKSLEKIKGCKGIVASRYHAMILGFLFDKDVLPVSYSKKMNNVLEDLKYDGTVLNVSDVMPKNTDVSDLFGKLDKTMLNETVEKTQQHFKMLDEKFRRS